MKVYPLVISTSGTQRYIFESTKRRENVGASYLVTRIEDTWLDEALQRLGATRMSRIRAEDPVEVVTANAGGITALVRDRDAGRALVTAITDRALREAPGLDVCGVVGPPFDWDGADLLADALNRARAQLPTVRLTTPGPQARFPGLPLAAQCTSSGLPAQALARPASGEEPQPRSAWSLAKLKAFDCALERLVKKMGSPHTTAGLRKVVEHLGERADWVAVVHVDGNGLGRVFQNLPAVMRSQGRTTAEEYANGLRDLSEGVDEVVERAFRATVADLESRGDSLMDGHLPLLPLVLGGDDLTVICDGTVALPFTERYLTLFKEYARADERVGGLLRKAGSRPSARAPGWRSSSGNTPSAAPSPWPRRSPRRPSPSRPSWGRTVAPCRSMSCTRARPPIWRGCAPGRRWRTAPGSRPSPTWWGTSAMIRTAGRVTGIGTICAAGSAR